LNLPLLIFSQHNIKKMKKKRMWFNFLLHLRKLNRDPKIDKKLRRSHQALNLQKRKKKRKKWKNLHLSLFKSLQGKGNPLK
ncbi:hypothetical protein KI387_034412, partial [Taxus chinensis]